MIQTTSLQSPKKRSEKTKNLNDHPVNKAEDRTKDTRVFSVMMGNKNVTLLNTSFKD